MMYSNPTIRRACFRIIIMPYKSTNKIKGFQPPSTLARLITILLLLGAVQGQSECTRRAFPSQVALRANESVLIDMDEYFQGSNLTFKVSPNNSYADIETTYQCSSAGSQRTGKVIASRYFLQGAEEIVAALAESQFTEGSFSFQLFQVQQNRLTTLNLPKENITLCSAFVLQMINATHFAPTIDCNHVTGSPRRKERIILSAVAQIGSPYADWEMQIIPLYGGPATAVSMELVQDVLVRGVSSAANSYIQVWTWNEQAHQLLYVYDRTKLDLKSLNLKAIKIYGRLLMVLDYTNGIVVLRLLYSKMLSKLGVISFPFYEDIQYNPVTSVLWLAKKGKIVSAIIDATENSVAVAGQGYNVYKYEHVRKMVVSDSLVVALGETNINIFHRPTSSSTDSRHYQLYPVPGTQAIYQRLKGDGFTILLLQNAGNFLQLSSCRVRLPLLKLATPRNNLQVVVSAISVLDRQQSSCSLNFTLVPEMSMQDQIYDTGYRADNEVVYGNQQGEGMVSLGKYGLGRDLTYTIKTITNSVLQSETKIRKSHPLACSFSERPIPPGSNISFLRSWQNLVLVQLSPEFMMRYYVCTAKSCSFGVEESMPGRITHVAHETAIKGKSSSLILEGIVREQDSKGLLISRAISIDNMGGKLSIKDICSVNLNMELGEIVAQVEIYNRLMYVVLPLLKEVRIYDLRQSECPLLLSLNVHTCPWGYFAPQSVHFNRGEQYHQDRFLLRQWDEILTVRLQNRTSTLVPILVTRNIIGLVLNYSLIYTAPYLLAFDIKNNLTYTFYFDQENIIQYLRQVPLTKAQFSQENFAKLVEPRHLAVNLQEEDGIRAVAVFKIDQVISGAQEYVRFKLREGELAVWTTVEDQLRLLRVSLVSGPTSSFLTCKANATELAPSIQLVFGRTPSTFEEYSENVTINLATADSTKQHNFKLVLSNVGDSVKRASGFPSRGQSVNVMPQITIDDRRWFAGSVFDYEFDCEDCGSRIIFDEKVNLEESEPLPVPADSFWLQAQGGTVKVLMGSALVELNYNHSVWPMLQNSTGYSPLSTLSLTAGGGHCLHAVPASRENQIIALCERILDDQTKVFFLSLVSTASYKGFAVAEIELGFGPEEAPKLISKNGLIIAYSEYTAFLLTLWEVGEQAKFIELDTVDGQDIAGRICSLDLTFNNTVEAAPITNVLFSLVVTECSSNVYFTSFLIYLEREEWVDEQGITRVTQVPNLHVSNAQNINLIASFGESHIQIPSEATVVQTVATRMGQQQLSILALYDRFHAYQFILTLSQAGVAYKMNLSKVYYKYGNYEAISVLQGQYLAIKYKSRLLGREERYGFFDLPATEAKGIKEYYMFSAYSLQNSGGDGHEIPWSYQWNTLVQLTDSRLQRLKVKNQLTARILRLGPQGEIPLNDVLYTQRIQITASNTASARSAVITLKAVDRFQLTAWQIVLIVVGGLVLLIGGGFCLRWSVRRYRKHKRMVPLLEDSLLEEAALEQEEAERISSRISVPSSVRSSLLDPINLSVRDSVDPSP